MFSKNTTVGIIGSGAMGAGIAQVAATAGHKVILFDNNKAALEKAKTNLTATLKKLIEKQKLTELQAKEISEKTIFSEDLSSLTQCKLIIEAIIENLDVKQKTFSEVEKIISNDCMFASNTSSLSVTSIASACEKPERVLGIHFFNPAPLMPLVEIIPGLQTDVLVLIEAKKIIDSWNKTTVIAKDTPGFIVNRIARPFYGEAIRIYEEGTADFSTIDFAMKEIGGFKMGPFELMDLIGNDVNYKVTEMVWEQFFYDPRYKPSLTQKRLFEAKRFGRKSGRGYYDYQAPSNSPPIGGGEHKPQTTSENKELKQKIFFRILAMLINEAVDALYLNVANKEDIDLAMIKGVNYPKGLLKWSDEIGLEKIYRELKNLQQEYGEDRYRPSILMKRMIDEGENFFT